MVGVDLVVWVDSWQMQCCGARFSVGGQVEWTLTDADHDWLNSVLGPQGPRSVDVAEEHHGGVADDAPVTAGTVTSIDAVRCAFAPAPGGDNRHLYPVPGSGRLEAVMSADGWTPDVGGLRFAGYLVHLTG